MSGIATHPYWAAHKDLALAHGLRACWSVPVQGSTDQVLGTFAVYYTEVREPSEEELETWTACSAFTAIAIESEALIARLRERDLFFDLSVEIYCIFDPHTQKIVQAKLQRPGLVAQVSDALRRHLLPTHALNIELTESSLMENVEGERDPARVEGTGNHVSLDDFGTGYSSLAYLRQFPIDKLKIDQSFVRALPEAADDAAIARTIVAMAHQLRMVVSAEGVETRDQARFLADIGCDELQGYYLGRPVAAEEAEAFFDRRGTPW